MVGFEGYKFKYKLIASHCFQYIKNPSSVHAHTFEITLYISLSRKCFTKFQDIEEIIAKTFGLYSGKLINEIPPFDEIEPTVENMGNVFYQLLKEVLAQNLFTLATLEINESPARTIIVNEANAEKSILLGNKTIKISRLLIQNIISGSTLLMLSGIEKGKPESMSIPAPLHTPLAPVGSEILPSILPPVSLSNPTRPSRRVSTFRFVLGFFCLLVCGTVLTVYLKDTGAYPSGSDIYGHLFKSDLLYQNLKEGNLYPRYTSLWYNGMQPFRYWAPLPYYLLATLQFLAGGDAVSSYLLFVFFAFVVGGVGWLLWGLTYNRMLFCTFLGVLWFFLPDNLRVFFTEGNFPRMVIAIFLPYLFYFVWRYLEYRKRWAIVPVIFLMSLIVLCHAMVAAMVGIATFIFVAIYSIAEKRVLESFYVICAMLLSFALCGFWLFPALQGGLLGMDASATSEVMRSLNSPASLSLNPILRIKGNFDFFYFGFSVFFLSAIGLFLANKKSMPGFYTVILVFLGTTTSMVPFLEKLPLNQLLWMARFTPIVYALFLLALLEWQKCRRYAIILMSLILVIDCLPSADLQKYYSQISLKITYSLSVAKSITHQRVSLLDVSVFDSYPSFKFSATEPKNQYTFGWAWQGATTAHNIVMINTAVEKGYYYYLFDRSLELGDDTVMVSKELITKSGKSLSALIDAAQVSGYILYEETNYTYIFHSNTPITFGVYTQYPCLAIGYSAQQIALQYPCFREGTKSNLTDYSLEELTQYKVIYLSGFSYSNKKVAQELLTRVADAGVKIIIDMNRIPIDPLTNRMTLLGVTAQPISFSTQYPELMYKGKIYDALPFKKDYLTWNTVYLENVKHSIGYSWFQNKDLTFLGSAENENIIFMGFNFLFHGMETHDNTIMTLMSELLEIEPTQLPRRELVPITIEYRPNKIIIDSPKGNINTTLAFQDNFVSEQQITNEDNLLLVGEPHTEIQLVYPYLLQGTLLSMLGLLGILFLFYFIFRKKRHLR